MAAGYWKRFAASATDFATRYRSEALLHTEVNIIALLAGFAIFILIVVATLYGLLIRDVSDALSEGMRQALISGTPPEGLGSHIVEELQNLRSRNILIAVGSTFLATAFFGYITARIALAPARDAIESQKQFIGNIAHELRTPLSTIKTNTEVALFSDDVPAEYRDIFTSNVEEIDRMSEIINNLLSFGAAARPEHFEFSPVDIGDIAASAMRRLYALAERKRITIESRMMPGRYVWGNATALEQILTNVLKNAVVYTPHGGSVTLTIQSARSKYVEIIVQDSGIGIARPDLFRIFEPFFRADRSRNRAQGGSGLGLTIVRELVRLHSGRIAVRSLEGQGTTVMILLPEAHRAAGAGRDVSDVHEVIVDFS